MTIDWNAFTPGTAAAVDLAGTWDPSLPSRWPARSLSA
jgi:hypothetical protein